jgi:ABC-2 type transport system ATP-binding protein
MTMSAVLEERAVAISADGVSKRYGKTEAIRDVSLSIPRGRIVAVLGPNGAGKTTALKAILGLIPFEGRLRVLGRDPRNERDALMRDVSFIADVALLPRWIRVRELVDFVEGVHPNFNREKALRYIAETKLTPDMKVKEMSKGMVVQLHLAIVMAIDAKLLVLDEPTLGLDLMFRKAFFQSLLDDYFDHEKTIIVSTHQVEEIEHIATDVIFIGDGHVQLFASVEEIAERFVELTVTKERVSEARELLPIAEREVFGKSVMLFEGVDAASLQALGEVRAPSLSDIFVAKMKTTTNAVEVGAKQ